MGAVMVHTVGRTAGGVWARKAVQEAATHPAATQVGGEEADTKAQHVQS